MKFLNYLYEDEKEDFQKIIDILEKDCSFYIDLLKSKHNPLYRGVTYGTDWVIPSLMVKKQVRQNREPQGMPRKDFAYLNKWLEKAGHVRRDKAVSATADFGATDMFGVGCYFFPIGKFNYTFVKAEDINSFDSYANDDCKMVLKNFPADPSKEEEAILSKNFITNKSILTAYNKLYEIWFDCKEYYVVPVYPYDRGWLKLTINPLKIVKGKMKV